MILASSTRLSLKQLLLVAAAMLCCHGSHTPPESEECMESMWSCPACFLADTPAEYLDYSLNVSALHVPGHEQDITVTVYPKSCPSLAITDFHSSSLPNWFRLEAISEATSAAAGEFERPHSRSEAYLCHNITSIIFKTCETDPMDFPKAFTWSAPANNQLEKICFRLTIHSDRHWCQQTKTCISLPSPSEMSGSASASGELEIEEKTMEEATERPSNSMCSSSRVDRCYRNWNCTGKKMVLFCGSNGMMFHSRCERRLWECLTNRRISISRNSTACTPTCDSLARWPSSSNCKEWQQFECGRPWEPRCTCRDQLYKLVQCDKVSGECWCVHDSAPDEMPNTRAALNCMDLYDFTANCLSR